MTTSAVVLGHRGGRGEGWPPENSLEAFARAIDEGAAGVELDVRLTADGVPVLLHDASLSHVTGGRDTRAVGDVDAKALARLEGGARIPTLDEALEALRGSVVNVELKGDLRPGVVTLDASARVALARVAARSVARAAGAGAAHVVFSSFDPVIVLALVAIAPRVPRAMLVGTRTARATMPLALGMRPVVEAIHLEESLVTPARVARLRAANLRVCAWTVNDPTRARALTDAGVEWLITDTPGAILAALGSGA